MVGLATLSAHAQDSSAATQQPAAAGDVEPGVLQLVGTRGDALGRRCELHSVASSATYRYLACGAAGVWLVELNADGNATLIAQHDMAGVASSFFMRDGKLWVEISSVRAQQLDLPNAVSTTGSNAPRLDPSPRFARSPSAHFLPPTAAAYPRLPLAEKPEARTGRVVQSEPGGAIVSLGGADGLALDDHVLIYKVEHENLDGSSASIRQRVLAVGRVVSLAQSRARIAFGVDEAVSRDDAAEISQLPLTASKFAPPRAGGVWDVAFMARPFVVIDNLGAGVFLDARVGYHMQAPVHFEALLAPFAVAAARGGTITPVGAVVTASFDSHLFEIGLGVGGQTVEKPDISVNPGTGLTLAQRVRLGARDGAHVEVISYVSLFYSEFKFSNVRVQAQLPLAAHVWMVAAGGGGTLGLGFGEVGMRLLLKGNGGPDSFFLTTTIGGVNVFRGCIVRDGSCTSIDYSGPLVGVGGEWRL